MVSDIFSWGKKMFMAGGDRSRENWHRIHINGKTENVEKEIFNLGWSHRH